jgi:hypothetical protein
MFFEVKYFFACRLCLFHLFLLFIHGHRSLKLLQNMEPVYEGERAFLLLAYVLLQGGVEPLASADFSIPVLFQLQFQSGN